MWNESLPVAEEGNGCTMRTYGLPEKHLEQVCMKVSYSADPVDDAESKLQQNRGVAVETCSLMMT